jgi:hypothetical protein
MRCVTTTTDRPDKGVEDLLNGPLLSACEREGVVTMVRTDPGWDASDRPAERGHGC